MLLGFNPSLHAPREPSSGHGGKLQLLCSRGLAPEAVGFWQWVSPAALSNCTLALERELWPVFVDPSQLENALLNLCLNARDAMPEGGRMTLETVNQWLDAKAARAHGLPEGQYLCLCVGDSGSGMPPDVMARAFEPFFTTKPVGQGTGLGLSMIYGFAKQSGGQVPIHSKVNEGTQVLIYLGQLDAGDRVLNELLGALFQHIGALQWRQLAAFVLEQRASQGVFQRMNRSVHEIG